MFRKVESWSMESTFGTYRVNSFANAWGLFSKSLTCSEERFGEISALANRRQVSSRAWRQPRRPVRTILSAGNNSAMKRCSVRTDPDCQEAKSNASRSQELCCMIRKFLCSTRRRATSTPRPKRAFRRPSKSSFVAVRPWRSRTDSRRLETPTGFWCSTKVD